MLNSILTLFDASGAVTIAGLLLCTLSSLLLGTAAALLYLYRNSATKGFVVTLAVLPAVVQLVIMLVNGNLGTGVAVAGAFSLVRFRSAPGSAREILGIFLAMAIGLATGMGYLGIALLFLVVVGAAILLLTGSRFGEAGASERALKILIPESLDYTNVFDDLFAAYTTRCELIRVKTTNLGSMYELNYQLALKDPAAEKKFLDELRCRNGNLNITCARQTMGKDAL